MSTISNRIATEQLLRRRLLSDCRRFVVQPAVVRRSRVNRVYLQSFSNFWSFGRGLSEFDLLQNLGQWTEWSNCDEREKDGEGVRVRYKQCGKSSIKQCPEETSPCPTKLKISGAPEKKSGSKSASKFCLPIILGLETKRLPISEAALEIKNVPQIDEDQPTLIEAGIKTPTAIEDDTIENVCPPEKCCPVFGSCRLGLKRSANGTSVSLCSDPCIKSR